MNILLVAVNAKYIHSNPAVFSLKACAGEYESHVSVAEFTINQQPSYMLREIYKRRPDVVAFSCYIWNRIIIGEVIGDLHKIMPELAIWVGGPEVSYDARAVIDEWKLRGVMIGCGEGSFYQLVSSYVNGTTTALPSILDGNGSLRVFLDDIPFWYRDLQDFAHRIIYYESSRGCPFSCSYCLSSIDRTMDFRSVERVCHDLDFFLQHNVVQVKFIDRTFNCRKDHALPILQYILEHDNGVTNFHFEIAADLLDEDYFDILRKLRPGAVQFEIGVQSTALKTISEIHRKMDFHKVADVVRTISAWHNIHIHLDLIAGLPYEDLLSFQDSFEAVYALMPQQLQLGFLKVLKGSAMEANAPAYELIYTSLPPYEVLSTKWLSYEDVCHLKQIEDVVEIYYNSGQFRNTLQYLRQFFGTAYALYDCLAAWYEKHDLFGIQSSRVRKYEILLEFGEEMLRQRIAQAGHLPEEAQELREAVSDPVLLRENIVYDLYLRENMKNRPSFAHSLEQWKDDIYHIIHKEAEEHQLFPQLAGYSYRELTKLLHVEVFDLLFGKPTAVLFCYEQRDPLTHNATTVHCML
ncbi:MAG: DUF4080 domain-containing protein [Eubacterium sp.]|nr:DUF4080 domain-containing protein [Eubacterium sp.]